MGISIGGLGDFLLSRICQNGEDVFESHVDVTFLFGPSEYQFSGDKDQQNDFGFEHSIDKT